MPPRRLPLGLHLLILLFFCAAMSIVWLLPALLAGKPYLLSSSLLLARNYASSGLFVLTDDIGRFIATSVVPTAGVVSAFDGRLSAILFADIAKWIGWDNILGWTYVSCLIMSAGLFAWWLAVAGMFTKRVAWHSTVLLGFMPFYWSQALETGEYNFAFLFLFLSFAAFSLLRRSSSVVAIVASAFLFGLSIAAKDVFMVFLPWYIVAYAWLYRRSWKSVIVTSLLFLGVAGIVYLVPYVGDLKRVGYPVNHNLARLWPNAQEMDDIYLHLYPDPYTYFFDRERFDQTFLASYKRAPLLEKLGTQKLLFNFKLGDRSALLWVANSTWLFIGSLPSFFQIHTMGGIITWLFIALGIAVLLRKDRKLSLALFGLVVVYNLVIRFVLHYERDHSMDVGWVFALLAALGVLSSADALSASWKRSANVLAVLITGALCLYFIQTKRLELGRQYLREGVSSALSYATAIKSAPTTAVVAVPFRSEEAIQIATISDRTVTLFRENTIEKLLEEKKLRTAFSTYGVTAIMGYEKSLTDRMKRELPSLLVMKPGTGSTLKVTPSIQLLLHIVR